MSNEHITLDTAKRLDALGFKGEHARSYEVRHYAGAGDKVKLVLAQFDGYNDAWKYFPTYTFTELWKGMTTQQRGAFLTWFAYHSDRDDLAEVLGIWLIENGHVEVKCGKCSGTGTYCHAPDYVHDNCPSDCEVVAREYGKPCRYDLSCTCTNGRIKLKDKVEVTDER